MRFVDALELEVKKRWRGSDGVMRQASKRQRRELRARNAIDNEIRSGLRQQNWDGQFVRPGPLKQGKWQGPRGRVTPNSQMGFGNIPARARSMGYRAMKRQQRRELLSGSSTLSNRSEAERRITRTAERKLGRLARRLKHPQTPGWA